MKFYVCPLDGDHVAFPDDVLDPRCPDCDMLYKPLPIHSPEASREKHVPVCEINGNEVNVVVGSIIHPADDKHFIVFIACEFEMGDKTHKAQIKYLPVFHNEPRMSFTIPAGAKFVKSYAYCNLHGLWNSEE